MSTHPFFCRALLPIVSLLTACGSDHTSLGGPDSGVENHPEGGIVAAKCEKPKSWTDPRAEGVVLATEKGRIIGGTALDATHAYYVVGSPDGVGAFELKRVPLGGGASEVLGKLGTTRLGGPLTLQGDNVIFVEMDSMGMRLASVPKKGGTPSVLLRGADHVVVGTDGNIYASMRSGASATGDDALIVRVNSNGKTTPVVRAPKGVAPVGVRRMAVAGTKVAWMPAQVVDTKGETISDAVVYVTDVADPSSRVAVDGPYSHASFGGLAMDETHVYFGAPGGMEIADVNTANSARSFGPTTGPRPYAIQLDGDMVYWQTLTPPTTQHIMEGANALARVPKLGGAGEWLVETSLRDGDSTSFAVGSCVLVWRGETTTGEQAIFMRPKDVPGRDAPIPVLPTSGTR
ncbi:MAG: hypothetical protein NVSMB1_05190 [Polyangiales bacterium]